MLFRWSMPWLLLATVIQQLMKWLGSWKITPLGISVITRFLFLCFFISINIVKWEREYENIVKNYIWLLYPPQVQNYITERTRQIGAINKFYEKTLGQKIPQIGRYSKADIPRAMLESQFIFVLSIAVLPDLNEDKFLKFHMDDRTNYWYNNEAVLGEIR